MYRKHFHSTRKKFLSTHQLFALDELLNLEKDKERWKRAQTHGGIGIPNLVLKLGQFLHTGCHCSMCKLRDVMLFMMACNIIGVSDRAKAVHYQRTLGDYCYASVSTCDCELCVLVPSLILFC